MLRVYLQIFCEIVKSNQVLLHVPVVLDLSKAVGVAVSHLHTVLNYAYFSLIQSSSL